MLYWTFKTLQKKSSHITNLLSICLKNNKVMNWQVCSYNERLFSLLGGRMKFLLFFASSYILTNMEDLKKAKEGQYRN